ncbi:MerR family transcriptional regulator [Clostridiaceae bacterium M8S5]|nr:MerR family transcriptional regulator [Clostridiaceae bacterium M8S5]
MRKYLIIGELAEMLNASTSSIRYYEKEGLISPCNIDDNGYRLYGYDELYKLENILLFRKLGIPLKQIKNIIDDYSIDDYTKILNSSLISIDEKIQELKNKRKHIINNLNYVENSKNMKCFYHVTHMPERILYCLHTGKILEYTIKETYELMKSQSINFNDTYQDSYIVHLNEDTLSICLLKTNDTEGFKRFDKIILKEGLYLSHDIFIEDITEMDIEKSRFYDYIEENALYPIGNLIVIEKIKYSGFYSNGMYYTLQVQVKSLKK